MLGNHLFLTSAEDHPGIISVLKDYCTDIVPLYEMPLYAPNYTVVNDRLFIDTDVTMHHHVVPRDAVSLRNYTHRIHTYLDSNIDNIKKLYPHIQVERIEVGAHNDGCFHTVADGAIISVMGMDLY